MPNPADAFTAAIGEALPGFLRARLGLIGADPDSWASEVDETVSTALSDLAGLLRLPFDRQPGTPLEVVRRAIAPLTASLAAAGMVAPHRDGAQERISPDDPYGLAPASAAELGESVLEASLAWGLAKTSALARPTLLVVTSNLMDASRFEPAAATAGHRVEVRRDASASVTPLVAFVDLETDAADVTIRALADAGVRVIAYGPHVDDHALVRAMALGAVAAEPRSRMFRNPGEHLRPLV